jgi:hypothetical protein
MAGAVKCLPDEHAYARRLGENGRSTVPDRWIWDHAIGRLEGRKSNGASALWIFQSAS